MTIVLSERIDTRFGDSNVSSTELKSLHENMGDEGLKDIRVVPVLSIAALINGRRTIAVGHCRIAVRKDDQFSVQVVISDIWSVGDQAKVGKKRKSRGKVRRQFEHFRESTIESRSKGDMLSAVSAEIEKVIRKRFIADDPDLIAKVAKDVCEMSRDNVSVVRDIRYDLESRLAEASDEFNGSDEYTSIVAQLLHINIISSKAADQAREAVREGLWTHICHSPIYHAYRKLQDPSLLNDYKPATFELNTWIRSHDAAVRQCSQLQAQMERETQTIQALVSSATGITSSREADAQSRFNFLVALISIGIGVPALFLAMYGANDIFKFEDVSSLEAIYPVGLPLLIVALVAIFKAPSGQSKKLWHWCGVITILLMFALVAMVLMFSPDMPPVQSPSSIGG